MRMSGLLKWGLAFALLLASFLIAYIRVSDAISDYQMHEMIKNRQQPGVRESLPPTLPPNENAPKPYPHDDLTRI